METLKEVPNSSHVLSRVERLGNFFRKITEKMDVSLFYV